MMIERIPQPRALSPLFALLMVAFLCALTACRTPAGRSATPEDNSPPRLVLSAGDVIQVSFPGAPNLDTKVKIGPEGNIAMPLVGLVQAEGKTAEELQADLLKLYESELQDKEVIVTVTDSGNLVYVMGAVARPGPLPMPRPLTLVEAIMQAGGFAPTANQKKVTVVRYEGDENFTYLIDLTPLFSGKQLSQFYLRPRDIVQVPQKMQWF